MVTGTVYIVGVGRVLVVGCLNVGPSGSRRDSLNESICLRKIEVTSLFARTAVTASSISFLALNPSSVPMSFSILYVA